jgi:hypothetical protein
MGLTGISCDLCNEECVSLVRCGLCGFDICKDCYDMEVGTPGAAVEEPT